jgi:hypothetical protein
MPHSTGGSLVLAAAIGVVQAVLGELYARQLWKIPLTDYTVGRIFSDISEGLCDQRIDQLQTSRFAMQVCEATDVKDARSVTCVRHGLENDVVIIFLVTYEVITERISTTALV